MRSGEQTSAQPPHLWRRRVSVGLVFAAGAVSYVGVRYGAAAPAPSFVGACQRLRDSGLAITSKDWFCGPTPWTHHAAYLGASLLVWLTFVVPCAVLAATGRRFTAMLPMLVAPFFTFSAIDVVVRWWGTEYWPAHHWLAAATNFVCVAAPVAAVSFASRASRARSGTDPSMASVFAAAAVLIVPTVGVLLLSRTWFGFVGGYLSVTDSTVFTRVLLVAVFGALLGPNRRWWPWSVAPVAVLASFGPTVAVLSFPLRFQLWTLFGAAMPLAVVGVLWAAWWPLSVAITRRTRGVPAADPERTLAVPLEPEEEEEVATTLDRPPVQRPRAVRPSVVLDSLAVSLLAVSLIMFRADPLPIQIGTSLPTFLGARASWQDARTRMDLHQAMSVADRYAIARGGYETFTAARGASADDSLAWARMADVPRDGPTPVLTMFVSTRGTRARIGALSASGAAFCIGRDSPGAPLTYASAPAAPGFTASRAALSLAMSTCGQAPWTPDLLRVLPIATLCEGRDGYDQGYLMCRMVQALGVQILSTAKP